MQAAEINKSHSLQHMRGSLGHRLGCDNPGGVGGAQVSDGVSQQLRLDYIGGAAVQHAAVPVGAEVRERAASNQQCAISDNVTVTIRHVKNATIT
jgi:hypothetical protein